MKWNYFNDIPGDSPLAVIDGYKNDRRKTRQRRKKERVTCLVVHMTGGTIVSKAIAAGLDPYEKCLSYYTTKDTSSHYLLGYDGMLFQMTDEHLRVGHVGVHSDEMKAYRDGRWARGKSAKGSKKEGNLKAPTKKTVELWKESWPQYAHPQMIAKFHGQNSINNCSVGVEMPPCGYHVKGKWTSLYDLGLSDYKPMRPGLRHTTAQHVGIALLACDIAERWGWPDGWWNDPKGGPRTPYLPGHEDVDLYGRSNKYGGWDPGALKTNHWWSWDFVTNVIRIRQTVDSFAQYVKLVTENIA
jgi:hypothetical protein